MKYAIVYSSRTGNTKQLADKIKEVLPKEDCIYYGEPCEEALKAPMLYIGFWTDKGSADEETMKFLKQLEGKKILLFGTAGFGTDSEYFKNILARTEVSIPSGNTILPGYMCQGRMQEGVKKRYDAMLLQNPDDEKVKLLLLNFDMALAHPNQEDLDGIVGFLQV